MAINGTDLHMPLRYAWLCLDLSCAEITLQRNACPACGSTKLWPLSGWLDRQVQREVERSARWVQR